MSFFLIYEETYPKGYKVRSQLYNDIEKEEEFVWRKV